jgi:hypothetical protein
VLAFVLQIILKFDFLSNFRCDAEPGALADYILALLKHNVPESEMRKELSSQLEEFLEKGSCYYPIAIHSLLITSQSVLRS